MLPDLEVPVSDPHTPRWQRSSFSFSNGECVEVADLGDAIGVRDSKNPDGAVLRFSRAEIDAFVRGVLAGEFDGYR
jgi:hypothetical protein